MLQELRAERDAIEQAIITLERVAHADGKRRGRPPAWLAELRARETGRSEPAPPKRDTKHKTKTP